MNEKEKYIYCDENGNVHILTYDDLPKCPITGEPVGVFIIGGKKEKAVDVEHFNCRCEIEIICNSPDYINKRGDLE